MQQFIEKYRDEIRGVLSGFDRLVLRGSLRRLNYGWSDAGLNARVAAGMDEQSLIQRLCVVREADQ